MSRLIEVQRVEACPSPTVILVGDVLAFPATGGRVLEGGHAVELLGPFVPGVMSSTGEILSPMGAPNTVLVRARAPGPATVELFTGDPFHSRRSNTLEIAVQE